ncbi:MAG: glycosyltransferase family 4 protein, partial [Anaerolineales bacterium]
MWNLPRSIPALIEELLPGRVIYYISDYWPSLPSAHLQRLQAPSRRWATRLPKRLLSLSVLAQLEKEPPIDLAMERPICVSRTVKEELMLSGVPVGHAKILPGGIDVNEFIQTRKIERWENGDQFSLLYAGRIEPEKGVHLVIQALGILAQRHEPPMVKLDIVGEGNPDYEEELKNAVIKGGLDRTVAFRGWVPRSRMPAVMANHDALVFPSRWKEPFGRSMVEAMAAGLAVLGTTTGGTAEILLDGKTGLTFPPGDANAMASQIQRLASDPSRGSELAEAGRRHVLEHFTLRRMADGIEAAVRSAVKGEAF